MGLWFPDVLQLSKSDFSVEIKKLDVLFPAVDGDTVHLIRLEDHEFLIFEFYDHGDVIEVTIGENSLQFGAEVFGIEK